MRKSIIGFESGNRKRFPLFMYRNGEKREELFLRLLIYKFSIKTNTCTRTISAYFTKNEMELCENISNIEVVNIV